MDILPTAVLPVLAHLLPAFTDPTARRFLLLAASAILTTGRRTVANLLRIAGTLAHGDPSSYRRFLSSARWSPSRLAKLLATALVASLCPAGTLLVVGDDTVDGHKGDKVHGKSRHRDPVRSSHSFTAWRYGHKWVVLAVLVQLPLASRPWALPVLVALYRDPSVSEREKRKHRTPAQIMVLLLRMLRGWFPDREIRFAGDAGFGSHEVARKCRLMKVGLVSRMHPEANLYEPAPEYSGHGRPRKKGARRPKPSEGKQTGPWEEVRVRWYGGASRAVSLATGTGHWYKGGEGLAEVRWVCVRRGEDIKDEYFYTTDMAMSASEIVEMYALRWNIETTFQEMREYVGLETTKGWCENTVLRAAPCLFGLYTVVALSYAGLAEGERAEGRVEWDGKATVTFSDAMTAVRRRVWKGWVFANLGPDSPVSKLPPELQDLLLSGLAPAA